VLLIVFGDITADKTCGNYVKMSLYPRVTEKRKTMDGMPVLQKELGGAMTRFVVMLPGTIVYTRPCGSVQQQYAVAFS